MFADVIDIVRGWIGVIKSKKASVRHIFLILGPGDTGFLEDIDNRCDWFGDGAKVIIGNPKIISTNDGNVILLSKRVK
jgi:hypothetical protein